MLLEKLFKNSRIAARYTDRRKVLHVFCIWEGKIILVSCVMVMNLTSQQKRVCRKDRASSTVGNNTSKNTIRPITINPWGRGKGDRGGEGGGRARTFGHSPPKTF